jgi:hypothetical protein
MGQTMTTEREPGLWDRLDTPTKVVAAIAGTIAALAAAAATGAALFGGNDKAVIVQPKVAVSPAAPNAADRVGLCMLAHHLRAPRVSVGLSGGGITYPRHTAKLRRCDWPPLTNSSTDGYTEVSVREFDLPKPASAPYNILGRFRASCDQLDVTFVLVHMFSRLFTSKRLAPGRIYQVDGVSRSVLIRALDRVPQDVESLVPLPSGRPPTFYVLYSLHFGLFDAHCAAGRPPAVGRPQETSH